MGLPVFTADNASTGSNQTSSSRDVNPANAQQQQQQSRAVGAGANTGAGMTRPKTEAENEADRLYEERIEEEYARMEGGC
ncbi:hypothetical protein S7711_03280 [Stachybotrys chartarum IBT 7711]|uniref:Uncharacterized protein n=1 Tax=Stachybotrys chartarum (strain CBS 109288 / IBT 7711) TaxID=1280523 RepID=A0A084AZQ6_STACB|nr:hypothetical protein S7711_03280 [Stachybotrys chartarum IBT 7711]KFA75761.1 hypothetical protein S40288_07896 [Stachybotrys chartarum IBT 40288]